MRLVRERVDAVLIVVGEVKLGGGRHAMARPRIQILLLGGSRRQRRRDDSRGSCSVAAVCGNGLVRARAEEVVNALGVGADEFLIERAAR